MKNENIFLQKSVNHYIKYQKDKISQQIDRKKNNTYYLKISPHWCWINRCVRSFMERMILLYLMTYLNSERIWSSKPVSSCLIFVTCTLPMISRNICRRKRRRIKNRRKRRRRRKKKKKKGCNPFQEARDSGLDFSCLWYLQRCEFTVPIERPPRNMI